MLRKLHYVCLIGSIGLVGDRIDLFDGHGPFTLTLYLVLAPLCILIGFLREPPTAIFRLRILPYVRRQRPFVVAVVLFLFLALISVVFSSDSERSAVAFSDLLLVVFFGYCISSRILKEPDSSKLILRAITFALIVYALFCIGESIAWSRGIFMDETKPSSWMGLTLAPQLSEFWVPRLSGATIDPNRAGFVLMMYLILLDLSGVKSRYSQVLRSIIAFLIFLTMSRSAILCWVAYYVFSKAFWRRIASRRVLAYLATAVVVISVVGIVFQREIETLEQAWEISDAISARLSVGDVSSGQNHIFLIERGFEAWQTSAKTVITGIGLASAPTVLEDFFGNNKHGNFHCLFITVLAELGLPAFLVLLFLLGYPILARRGAAPGLIAFIVFNISYQSHMEPLFWIVLPLLWSLEEKPWPKLRSLALSGAPAT